METQDLKKHLMLNRVCACFWGCFSKKSNLSPISVHQSCKSTGTSQVDLYYHLPHPTSHEETLTFSCVACHQAKKPSAYLPKSSVFTPWIILNAGWVKNHRARSSPPVIVSRGVLRNECGSFPHVFLKTYVIAVLSQGWGLFSEGEAMEPFKRVDYSYKKQLHCDCQLQPQTPQ